LFELISPDQKVVFYRHAAFVFSEVASGYSLQNITCLPIKSILSASGKLTQTTSYFTRLYFITFYQKENALPNS
jgi:hypothetical protein